MEYFTLILIPLLIHILYTDFKRYQVHTLVLFSLLVLSIGRFIAFQQLDDVVSALLINAVLLLIILSAVLLIARLRKKEMKQIIGSGDIFFLVIAAVNFAPVWFNIYLFSSALLAIIFLLIRFPFNKEEKRVPYAGIMALLMTGFIVFDVFTTFSSYNDNLILALLVK